MTKPCAVWCPHPIVPTPGMRPIQFAARMKMKMVAKNQNVRSTRCVPMMLSSRPYRLSTSHSRKFCAPLWNLRSSRRVAICAKTISPSGHDPRDDHRVRDGKAEGPADLDGLLRQAVFRPVRRGRSRRCRGCSCECRVLAGSTARATGRPIDTNPAKPADRLRPAETSPRGSRVLSTVRPPVFRTFSAMPEGAMPPLESRPADSPHVAWTPEAFEQGAALVRLLQSAASTCAAEE